MILKSMLVWAVSIIALMSVLGCSPSSNKESFEPLATLATPPFSLKLTQSREGKFQLEINTDRPGRTLFFSRSANNYRMKTYTAVGSSAALSRIDGFDTIQFAPDSQRAVFEIEPYTGNLPGTYTAFIPFTNGGQAIYLGAFELLRADNVEAVKALAGNIDVWQGEQFPIPLTLNAPAQILLNGERHTRAVNLTIQGNGPYAYMGPGKTIEGKNFIGLLDPGMPAWLAKSFDDDLAKIFEALERRFGRSLNSKASVLFAFKGYEPEGISNTGGVLPGGQMVLEMSGSLFETPNERLKGYIQWFLTHESAHLFQYSDKNISYSETADKWLSEGSANAVSHIILTELGTVPASVVQSRYAQSYEYCVASIKGSSMAEITKRDDQSHYDCGDLVWRIVDAALPEDDVFTLWNLLIKHAKRKAGTDNIQYSTQHFFDMLAARGLNSDLSAALRAFIAGPNPDPAAALKDMMTLSGIQADFDEGTLTAIVFPK